jgi:hypothetical protein
MTDIRSALALRAAARAASGHATVMPEKAMNSRRPMWIAM